MRLPLLLGALGALAIAGSTAQAQTTLTTLFASNNGLSGNSMVFFDLTVKNPVRVTGFELNSYATVNSSLNLQVYSCATTYVGNETTASAWTQIGQDDGNAVGAGQDLPSAVTLQSPIVLQPGTYGMALISNQGHRYTNGDGTNQQFSDNFLQIDLGASASATTPFSSSPISPRVWNGSIVYTPAAGTYADFTADFQSGTTPLQVQFTDATFSSNTITKWEWNFGDGSPVSTLQNPQHTFTGVGFDNRYTVSLKVTDDQQNTSTETKKDFIIVNPFPVASATAFGAGSTIPAGTPGPIQMPAFSSTYSSSTQVRGWYAQAPVTFTISGFNVPNEQSEAFQSVWCFTIPGTTRPSSYTPTAADTLFLGTGPVGTTLTPPTPIVIQQGTWVAIMGACHDATGTTQRNSYGTGSSGTPNTTVLGAPMDVRRCGGNFNFASTATPGTISMFFSTSGSIARVDVDVPGNLQSTIPVLAASGDTPYFGANPQLDMTASIPGAQAGLLLGSLNTLPGGAPTPFGRLLIDPNFTFIFVVPTGSGSVQLPIPMDKSFAALNIHWQGAAFDLTNNVNGMTNGVTWVIGQQ
jgi:PKD repeat protein